MKLVFLPGKLLSGRKDRKSGSLTEGEQIKR